jgi:hypothetical protein
LREWRRPIAQLYAERTRQLHAEHDPELAGL